MPIKKRAWADHDAAIPFRDPRLAKLNGTNMAGRRPHSLVDPQRLRAANDNHVDEGAPPKPAPTAITTRIIRLASVRRSHQEGRGGKGDYSLP
jgi:hypothetical protein